MTKNKKKIYVIATEHMDLVWRRCFEKDVEFNGQNFISYADLQEYYIKDSIKLCKKYPFYNFTIESVAVLDKFLERNSEYEKIIEEYIKQKKIYIPFSGINITDSNMISGESLVRNYLYGYYYLKNKYNYVADGMDRNDAFGNSAQLPQIARGFGVKWVYHLSYSSCTASYWRGLDGSTVFYMNPENIGNIGGYPKYRPCPVCNGYKDVHCDYCEGYRIDKNHMEKRRFHLLLDEKAVDECKIPGYICAGGEEVLPMEDIITWAEENRDKYDIEFISFEKYKKHYKDFIENADNPPQKDVMSALECNCNNTGTYVTRIKMKQKIRELENSIFAAESLAASEFLKDKSYPYNDFKTIWSNALFSMFHDSVTSTHIDAGYDEICEKIDEAKKLTDKIIGGFEAEHNEQNITVFNPYGIKTTGLCRVILKPGYWVSNATVISALESEKNVCILFMAEDVEAFSKKVYKVIRNKIKYKKEVLFSAKQELMTGDMILTNKSKKAEVKDKVCGDVVLENEFYKVYIENNGIAEIYDKKINETVAKESEYKVGEWILEHDEGSPWATLSPDMRRQPLSKFTKLTAYEKAEDFEKVTFKISPGIQDGYAEASFEIIYSVMLAKNIDKVMFSSKVKWSTQNYRLRIAFPISFFGKHIYEIPYGFLERTPYENDIVNPDGSTNWASKSGDYPAINWAGVDGENRSITLFNNGTPSYQINKDSVGNETIYLSVLRSPSVPTYLHAPEDYTMTAYEGMMDWGNHSFLYALKSYDCKLNKSSVVADGIGHNARFVILDENMEISDFPRIQSGNARVSSITPSQDKKGLIIRVAEYRGEDGRIIVKIPENIKAVYETDLKEDKIKKVDIKNSIMDTDIGHFEIKTFYLEF